MEVLHVTPLDARSSDLNEKGQRTYTISFYVVTDDRRVGPGVVRESVGIVRGDPYLTETEYDNFSFCKGINASCKDDDGKGWTVTVTYGPPEAGQESPTTNPFAQPVKESWSFSRFSRPVDKTVDGEAILNSAGEPFLNAIERDDSRPLLTCQRNEPFFNASLAYSYRDTVNSDSFRGAAAGQSKVFNISGDPIYDPDYGTYYAVTYEFEFSADGFEKEIVSMGLNEIKNEKLVPIMAGPVQVTEAQLLDSKGASVPKGGPPHPLKFKVYNETSFSVFNLS